MEAASQPTVNVEDIHINYMIEAPPPTVKKGDIQLNYIWQLLHKQQ